MQKDSNDSIRIPIINSLISLKAYPELNKYSEFIIPTLAKISADDSWTVRLTVAHKIH